MTADNLQRLAEIHIVRARTEALALFAFTSTVYPEEWGKPFVEEAVTRLLDFAFHARRINQICELSQHDFGTIDVTLVQISEGDPGSWEKNYHWALNRLMHTKEFTFGSAHADHRRIFTKSASNLQALYVKIKTDQHERATISLYGLVDCYLSRVIPEIRSKYPMYRF